MSLNIHLDQLAYFREAAKRRTWAEAAKSLHISQPALSQSLRELERRLGVSLFERDGRRQRITATGSRVLEIARQILSIADGLEGELDALARGAQGHLRVGMVDAACLYLFSTALSEFRAELPDVTLQLTVAGSARLLQLLERFELDAVVVVGPIGEDATLSATLLLEEPLYLYGHKDLTAQKFTSASPWIGYPARSRTRRLIDAGLAHRGIAPTAALESGNPAVLHQMVQSGLGWCVLPRGVVARGSQGPELAPFDPEPVATRPIYYVRRVGTATTPAENRFRERLVRP